MIPFQYVQSNNIQFVTNRYIGSFTRLSYEKFILEEVLPEMNTLSGPYLVMVMVNGQIQRSGPVANLAAAAGIGVEFLAPYSPDTNPFEEAFSVFKSWVRRHGEEIQNNSGDPSMILTRGIFQCLDQDHARNLFENSGYIDYDLFL